ncbi:MAG: TetR/AcrR family transcriptional regulator [Myxococcales bacterium]|nr:TetR/AcrR family transcriptional regulator [Myxococcales bacterium]
MTPPAQPDLGRVTRQKIIAATIVLVAEEGWHGVTTRQVAERAGVNNAAVNYHFTTKVDLLRAAAAANVEAEFGQAMQAMFMAPTLKDGMRLMLSFLGAIDLKQPSMVMLLETMMQSSRDEPLREGLLEVLAAVRAQMAARVAADQATGHLAPHLDPMIIATLLAALIDGLLLHRMVDPSIDITRSGVAAIDALLEAP